MIVVVGSSPISKLDLGWIDISTTAIKRLRAVRNMHGEFVKIKSKKLFEKNQLDKHSKEEQWSNEQRGAGAGDDWQRA